MIPSPFLLEQQLGMQYYISDTPGIGGNLRTIPEDFIVEEIPLPGKSEGKYLICRLTKKNWELQRAVKEIAKILGISHKRISWAGTKDKRAVTSQYISLYNVSPGEIQTVSLKDITLEVVGTSNTELSLGQLDSNRFCITIRDCIPEDLEERVLSGVQTVKSGIPNYFGLQRFGGVRPVTHLVGKDLLRGDFEAAILTYVGYSWEDEPEDTRRARSEFFETGNVREALKALPVHLRYERAILHHLTEHPQDYQDAMMAIPPKLLSMFVSAYQSYLFNCALSWRLENDSSMEPVPGDYLLFQNGRHDIVTPNNTKTARLHAKRGTCRITIFMPGADPLSGKSPTDQFFEGIMAEDGITHGGFARISEILGKRFDGAHRPISMRSDISHIISENDVQLQFTLPPGHYATTVCREFMKADPRKFL